MFTQTTSKRNFTASNVKQICLLANSRQADLIGSRIIQNLRRVSGDSVQFTGYGGEWMKKEGFEPTIDMDMDMLTDKQFHTYRKTKSANEAIYFKWNPMNLVNKGYVRKTDDAFNNVSAQEKDLIKWLRNLTCDCSSPIAHARRCAKEDLPESS